MSRFGWCLSGHHSPGPHTHGCPGQYVNERGEVVRCDCPCHTRPATLRSESNPTKKRK